MKNLLYRYINWNDTGSKRLFAENEIYFYTAQTWEKDGEYQFDLADYTEEMIFDMILKIAIDMHNNNFNEYVLWMNVHANKYGIDLNKLSPVEVDLVDQYFARQLASERAANPSEFIEFQKKLYFDRTGIISLSKTKRSYDLWSSKRNSYGDNIVCVGLDIDILKDCLKNLPNCTMNEITYCDEIQRYKLTYDNTGYKSLLQLLDISFTLTTNLRLEEEVRIQRLLLDNSLTSKERKVALPTDIFKEVILYKDADELTYSEVQSLANQKGISKLQFADIKYDDNTIFISEV